MARIHTFSVGFCTHPACIALRGAGLQPRVFPARAYLLETRHGLYLWDTGYSARFATETCGIYAPYRWVTPVTYHHEQDNLCHQLDKLGVRAADLLAILLSHFHADHFAGLADYPKRPIYASTAALASIKELSGIKALFKAFVPGLLPSDFADRIKPFEAKTPKPLPNSLAPFRSGWPVDAGEEIWAVPLPGHAEGHMGAFIETDRGWVLLASDAAWAPESYRELRGPSELSFVVQHDRKDYFRTLARLNALYMAGIQICLTHEGG
jgi:glyoxylase-like metal-dependent hydrolase (beta-lactamase superfamily II)